MLCFSAAETATKLLAAHRESKNTLLDSDTSAAAEERAETTKELSEEKLERLLATTLTNPAKREKEKAQYKKIAIVIEQLIFTTT